MTSARRSGASRRLLLQPARPQGPGLHREYQVIACSEAIARGEDTGRRLGSLTAMHVEDSIHKQGWPEGAVCGPEEAIASNFGVGVRLMRQAFRILEARGACRQRRGRGGGLVVLRPSPLATATALADHLRWTGATLEHIWDARAFFEPLAAASAARDRGPGRNDDPVLALVLACLDEFPGGRIETDWPTGASPEDAAGAAAAALRARRERHERLSPDARDGALAPDALSQLAQDSNNLAAAVAARIGRSITYQACQAQVRLGSLWDLADTHGVSLSVMIAAVRILEDAGVVVCQKGRAGGVRLRTPNGDTLVSLVHGYLAASRATEAQCVSVCHKLNLQATERAATTRTDRLLVELEGIYRQMTAAQGFGVMEAWYLLQRCLHEAGGNPALHVITRCLAGYSVRAFADPFTPPSPDVLARMVDTAGTVVEGVRRRDAALALEAQRRTRFALDERHRRRAPALAS